MKSRTACLASGTAFGRGWSDEWAWYSATRTSSTSRQAPQPPDALPEERDDVSEQEAGPGVPFPNGDDEGHELMRRIGRIPAGSKAPPALQRRRMNQSSVEPQQQAGSSGDGQPRAKQLEETEQRAEHLGDCRHQALSSGESQHQDRPSEIPHGQALYSLSRIVRATKRKVDSVVLRIRRSRDGKQVGTRIWWWGACWVDGPEWWVNQRWGWTSQFIRSHNFSVLQPDARGPIITDKVPQEDVLDLGHSRKKWPLEPVRGGL